MKTCSIGTPFFMPVSLTFTILIAFSLSFVQSESTPEKPPPPPPPSNFRHSPPPPSNYRHPPRPPSKSHHNPLPPPPPPPRPLKQNYGHHPPPPPLHEETAESAMVKSKGLNAGKIVGLVFCGIEVILQIAVVTYLTYKRKQLYHVPD